MNWIFILSKPNQDPKYSFRDILNNREGQTGSTTADKYYFTWTTKY